jgi:predicted SAM-dependent methyltransferase
MESIKAALKKKLHPLTVLSLLIWQQRLLHFKYLGVKYKCPICQTHLRTFVSLRNIANGLFVRNLVIKGKHHKVEDYETLNIDQFLCPICGAQDKARLYALYFEQVLPKLQKKFKASNKLRLVHFAPEGGLGEQLRSKPFIKYTSADLLRENVDRQEDLTHLSFKNNSIDMFICSHILEHIDEDEKAMRELFRTLKRGGTGIVMVPLLLTLPKTYYDPSIKKEADRLKHYGQADHVRVYSKKDFLLKLKKVGFFVKQYTIDQLGEKSYKEYAITPQSVLYVVEKPNE